jgi:hypothetical protein
VAGPVSHSQSTPPNIDTLLENLTRSVLDVLAVAGELDQLIRWLTVEVYELLLKRIVLSARARTATGRRAHRPRVTVLRTICSWPHNDVVEGVVLVRTPVRVRAVAIRLEADRGRWRATAVSVL